MTASLRFGLVLALLFAAAAPGPLAAQTGAGVARPQRTEAPAREIGPSGLPLPRFVSLRAAKVNLRTGPGIRYPIEWVYARKGLPLEVIDEFETWRRVRDWQGSVGWVHQSMLSGRRGALVVGAEALLRRAPEDDAAGLARIEAAVVGRLRACARGWCRIEAEGFEGWLHEREIYGVYAGETVE
jgi:SH3-like domain-containing protein